MPHIKGNYWDLAQGHLKETLDAHSYKNWFSQAKYDSYDNGHLVVRVPSEFFASWLRDHYYETVCEAMKGVAQDFHDVSFVSGVDSEASTQQTRDVAHPTRARAQASVPGGKQAPAIIEGFNPRYTFDRFVIGSGNRFAHAAAKAVAESPANAYNPLFLYGGTGLGKTHLMQAIGQEVVRKKGDAKVVFISSEQFTNQLIESIARKATDKFRAKYRRVDILLIDDIHFIAGKEATQEEFFHTFNELHDMRKQIVLSSDRGPKEIEGLEERLVSRFEWGLVIDIQPPVFETRVAILQNKAAEEGADVPMDVIQFIATHITRNIRELEGTLITLLAYARLNNKKITLAVAEEVLRDLMGSSRIKPLTIELVQRAVAEHFDVRIADLKGRSRHRQVAFPRQVAMHLCKTLIPGLSLSEIGEAFGGKDHTTVLYSCQKMVSEAASVPSTRDTLARLEKVIRSS